jgi:hypothetical protein
VTVGVCEAEWVPSTVGVPVVTLRIGEVWDNVIGLEKAANLRVVVSEVVVVQARGVVEDLARVTTRNGKRRRALGVTGLAVSGVFVMLDLVSVLVGLRPNPPAQMCGRAD